MTMLKFKSTVSICSVVEHLLHVQQAMGLTPCCINQLMYIHMLSDIIEVLLYLKL